MVAVNPIAPQSEIGSAFGIFRRALVGAGVISGLSNVLALSGSIFMLEVYDRVLPSRSVPTLQGLVLLVLILYGFQAGLEMVRARLMGRIGVALDELLGERVYDLILRYSLEAPAATNAGLQPLRDLDQVRSFMASSGPTALFDLPWIPLYLGLCFLFHFWLGVTALAGALVLVGITAFSESKTKLFVQEAAALAQTRYALAEAGRRNAEVLRAMGMGKRLTARWSTVNRDYIGRSARASDIANDLGSISRAMRMALQSMVLAVGAFLVIQQEATSGVMIAASILTGRGLAPVDLAIANWKGFVGARQSCERLGRLFSLLPKDQARLRLPAPTNTLQVEGISAVPPGLGAPAVIQDVSFSLTRGQALGIIGPSASGKTSLARTLVGVWKPYRGRVRLDGAAIDLLSPDAQNEHIGYLPQDVELFEGTVAGNICRFASRVSSVDIVDAATMAGAHDMILRLPDGYETQLGENGAAISAGQRQRIGLARALYGNPFLVVLDEPNSNLDADGDQALTHAILNVRARGGIVIIIAHRPSGLAAVDQVLVMAGGRVAAFGPKDEVLRKFAVPQAPLATPLKVIGEPVGVGS